MKRIVFEGETGVGYRTIYEGDIVEFRMNAHTYYKGIAFYSNTYTTPARRVYSISLRLDDYDYGIDPENTHTFNAGSLITHIIAGPKEVRRSGFGKWIAKHV